ncbi:mevalonate kinase isoform X1 [Agrilus planipennis]|uniref:Mevalonate kinase n=1 Tax=Agrilus planipennis TaxID=224129 RepID=A0A1W4XCS0_AGRPL|nr:mevalonate kinase isoform X1 [Agrilus planipennis]
MVENNFQQSSEKLHSELLIKVSAPGKVILHGEHSVVFGKLAIAASLGLRTKLSLSELKSDIELNMLTIQLKDLNLIQSYDVKIIQQDLLAKCRSIIKNNPNYSLENPQLINHEEILQITEDFVTRYSKPLNPYQNIALVSLFYLFAGTLGSVDIKLRPININLETDLTINAGTGSSASYLVTLSAAFIQYIRFKANFGKNQIKNGQTKHRNSEVTNSIKFDTDDLQLISKWAYNAEKIIHGPASGIDNTICTFGSMVEFRKGSQPRVIELPTKFRMLLINSMVTRNTKSMIAVAQETKKEFPTVFDSILDAMNAVAESALETIIRLSQLKTVVEHENCDSEMVSLFKRLEKLTDMNQNLLAAIGVSHPKLDRICSILKENGLHGKLTGAGGGGFAIALVNHYHPDDKIKALMEKLETEGFSVQLTDLGGPGVLIDEFKVNS